MIVATPDGVEDRAVTRDLADRPSLSDEQVHAVAQLLKKVGGHYGWPQDIEWGWKRDRLYQFQSRPVTTIQPRWTRDDPAERFPNPITPLSWDFIRARSAARCLTRWPCWGCRRSRGTGIRHSTTTSTVTRTRSS